MDLPLLSTITLPVGSTPHSRSTDFQRAKSAHLSTPQPLRLRAFQQVCRARFPRKHGDDRVFLSNARLATISRLNRFRSEPERLRLMRRLDNITRLSHYLSANPAYTIDAVFGWGRGCMGALPRQGVSEYDTVFLRDRRTNQCLAVQLDSCLQIQREYDPAVYARLIRASVSPEHHHSPDHIGRVYASPNALQAGRFRYNGPLSAVVSRFSDMPLPHISPPFRPTGVAVSHQKGIRSVHVSRHPVARNSGLEKTELLQRPLHKRESEAIPLLLLPSNHSSSETGSDGESGNLGSDSVTERIDRIPVRSADTLLAFHIKDDVHGNHSHFKLAAVSVRKGPDSVIQADDEGCPCCTAGLDFDEFAAAVKEMQGASDTVASAEGASLSGGFAEMTPAHWGMFLGVAAPFSLIGLTAAYRNIKGTWHNRKKIKTVIKGIEYDIRENKRLGNHDAVARLTAFRNCLKYSQFDAEWNFVVPGVINGVASSLVLSSAVWHSPWALPVIGIYAAAQAGRNVYELVRIWNRIIPEKSGALISIEDKGVRKLNQITRSKRTFHAANAIGFTLFATGAVITFLSIPAIGVFGAGAVTLPVGLTLMGVGAASTGVMNNVWPRKFKPRNGSLGVDRLTLDQTAVLREMGRRREIKKVLKDYKKQYLPITAGNKLRRFGCKVLTALPFGEKKGAKLTHKMNLTLFTKNKASLARDRVSILKAVVRSVEPGADFSFLKGCSPLEKAWGLLEKLGIRHEVVTTFVEEFWKGSSLSDKAHHHGHSGKHSHSHGACCGTPSRVTIEKSLIDSGLFSTGHHPSGKKHPDHGKTCQSHPHTNRLYFNFDKAAQNAVYSRLLGEAIDYHLFFHYVDALRYEQYGLNDFYWALEKEERNLA